MTTLTATAPTSLAIFELEDLLANCGAFQEAAGTEGDADETRKFIHYPLQENQEISRYPFAIYAYQDTARERLADATYLPRGSLVLSLGKLIPTLHDPKHEEIDFLNFEGAVIDHIENVSGNGGHFVWTATQTMAPSKTDARNLAIVGGATPCYYWSMWDLEWSPV
jgi:hypothetical protein